MKDAHEMWIAIGQSDLEKCSVKLTVFVDASANYFSRVRFAKRFRRRNGIRV